MDKSFLAGAKRLRSAMDAAGAALTDEQALAASLLYPLWESGCEYAQDQRVRHIYSLYRCVQAHTAQPDWEPAVVPALWAVVSLEEWPVWVQPQGAHDAYGQGERVRHNGEKWISTAQANTWAPGVYGWEQQ